MEDEARPECLPESEDAHWDDVSQRKPRRKRGVVANAAREPHVALVVRSDLHVLEVGHLVEQSVHRREDREVHVLIAVPPALRLGRVQPQERVGVLVLRGAKSMGHTPNPK